MTQAELQLVERLTNVIARLCDEFCKKPERIPEYNEATQLLKEQQNAKNCDA